MPLKKGKSQKTVSANIQTLVDDYQKTGRIGTSKPANKKAAVKQAVAIALRQAGKPKKFEVGGLVAGGPSLESSRSSSSSGGSPSQETQPARRKPEYLPLPNQSGQVEDQFPKFKRTTPRMQWTRDPDAYAETTKQAASMRHLLAGQKPRDAAERNIARDLGMAFKKGGKVSSKKGPK